ncbi:hypothetical protein CYY_009278 [Polysphondylium violaceum]|uniref:DUF6314 domain-containing protein n=1 Tax=Polysphondylium violaceum TaxID=133409 RepID=A0A8J4V350_9MYCE|nr:hypothetical protein CYY_009278 [Polysphondylium violaceum]
MFKIFQSFAGRWRIQRDIVHRTTTSIGTNSGFFSSSDSSNKCMTVNGSATFSPLIGENNTTVQDAYQYSEEGVLRQPDGQSFNVSQKYIYKLKDDIISVYFDEKPERILHTLEFKDSSLSSQVATGHHLCGCDTYDATFHFTSPQEFKIIYTVNGPKKAYTMTTKYFKLEQPS